MSENDSTPRARKRKSMPQSPPGPTPIIRAGEVYFASDLIEWFGMGKNTLNRWKRAGMLISQPGISRQLVVSDDVIAFIRQHRDLEQDS